MKKKDFFSEMREVRRLLKTLNKGCRFCNNQVLRVESELLKTKQRLFRFDESCTNQELRHSNRESSLDSRLDLDARKDRESSVNLLLNGTVSSPPL